MRCSSCVKKLEDIPLFNSNIQNSKVYFGQSLMEIEAFGSTTESDVLSVIEKLGFKAKILENKIQSFDLNKKSNRSLLSKIAVAGFCAANIMLFSVPIYAGADHVYKIVFSFLSFSLFLPIVFYSGVDFYKNAMSSIKRKSLSVDLPISLALILGFVFSSWNLFAGHYDYLYFDSTASFIFLILGSRFLLQRLQQNFIATYSSSDLNLSDKVQMQESGLVKNKEDLREGDIIVLFHNQTLPVEAVQQSDFCDWNTSLITGEGTPKILQKEMPIKSGSLLVSKKCVLKVTSTYHESDIYKIHKKLEDLKNAKVQFVQFIDKFSNYFIASVFVMAGSFFAYYSFQNVFEAFQRSLALLIVACPCALALGTPLAYMMGVYRAKQKGILIFNKDIFDRVLLVRNIFFDKTGTLTYGFLHIKNISLYKEDLVNIILNLEKLSDHPVALALRREYFSIYKDIEMSVQTIPGLGVSANIGSDFYEFKRSAKASEISSTLYKNGASVLDISFEDAIREDSASVILKMKKYFHNIFLLSGDNDVSSQKIAEQCGIKNILSMQTPQMKLSVIEAKQPALMVGDGLNDALALQAASVGITVQGSVQLCADSSDAYLLKKGVGQILVLISLAHAVRKTIFLNFSISLVYNLTAGTLALLGYINPLTAAILMPLSSVFILLNTLRGVR